MSDQDLRSTWELIHKLRGEPKNRELIGELARVARDCQSNAVKDYIARSVFLISDVVIYPFERACPAVRFFTVNAP